MIWYWLNSFAWVRRWRRKRRRTPTITNVRLAGLERRVRASREI